MINTGIFGGTFDPIHNGHLALAEKACQALNLDELFFIPAAVPPHKSKFMFSFENRIMLTEKAINGHHNWFVSDLDYSETDKSYSALLLERFIKEFPNRNIFFLIGADNVTQMQFWKNPAQIFNLAQVVVFSRKTDDKSAWTSLPYYQNLQFIDMDEVDISSTEIRRKIQNKEFPVSGIPQNIMYLIKSWQKNESD